MKELSRFEIAVIKRTAQNVKSMRTKKAKIETKLQELTAELVTIDHSIDLWEAPIRAITGGATSEEVLNHLNKVDASTEYVLVTESIDSQNNTENLNVITENTSTEENPFSTL